ncbi:hypothetical protein [Streptomyces sp. NPDC006134]|uniref:hypothetical protein n=1 Tax=Streptomyces sp. NPDC006134 TaxID=3154467 RepID=UPI0034064CA9
MSADTARRLAEEYGARWNSLTERWSRRPGSTLGTLGPSGTSSHLAAGPLVERHGLRVQLFDTFDDVLAALVGRKVEYALVPSAYQGLTRFHWHRDLRLVAFFPQATPEYGIAAPPDTAPPQGGGPVSVAAMWEVRRIYAEVVPAALSEREVRWIDADSTQHAAEILAAGGADLAVTNAPGVRAHGLSWVARRPGAEIVWTVFGHAEPSFR